MAEDIILSAEGTPFPDKRQAALAAKRGGVDATHEPTPALDGQGWILKRREKPVQPQAQASPQYGHESSSVDPDISALIEEAGNPPDNENYDPEPKGEKYFWVQLEGKRHENDSPAVFVSVNAQPLMVAREKRVPLPERYVKVLLQSKVPQFSNKPGQLCKVVGQISCYPLHILGKATKEDFLKWRAEGTRINNAATANLAQAALQEQAAAMN